MIRSEAEAVDRKQRIRDRYKGVDTSELEVIPAKAVEGLGESTSIRRVAAYVRVSTDNDEQTSSYELQKNYYTEYIKAQPGWEFVGIYDDEGISGTSLEHRKGMTYIFLDEVQEVPSFEKVVDSLYIRDHVDVYITGSNAYMLSSELATLLSGRYTEIKMLPFSFREYMAVTGMAKEEAFAEFMKTGGIPYVAVMNRTDEKIDQYLEGIYNTVIVKDIEQRQARREKEGGRRKITDIALLKTIARYLASVIGSPVSMKSITDYLTSSGRKVSQNTVSDYVEALTESFIFYPVERFDIVGKQLLKVNNKFYMVDMGIRNHILPRKRYDLGFTIENIVFLELTRRGGQVNIGKYGSTEVDFVVQKEGILTYYQVTADMTAEETFEREMRPLRSIQDNYEKIVLTLDRFSLGNYDGIKVVNVIDWLLA